MREREPRQRAADADALDIGMLEPGISAAQLAQAGVKRISVGGALSRLALAAFMSGAREMIERGGFTWVRQTVPSKELKAVSGRWT